MKATSIHWVIIACENTLGTQTVTDGFGIQERSGVKYVYTVEDGYFMHTDCELDLDEEGTGTDYQSSRTEDGYLPNNHWEYFCT